MKIHIHINVQNAKVTILILKAKLFYKGNGGEKLENIKSEVFRIKPGEDIQREINNFLYGKNITPLKMTTIKETEDTIMTIILYSLDVKDEDNN